MTVDLTLTDLTAPGSGDPRDLVVLGPSLGTAVGPLWSACAALLGPRYRVLGWDLPGHGRSAPVDTAFTVADLAEAVLVVVRPELDALGPGARLLCAGVSLGGAVALQLALADAGVAMVAVVCSGARIGEPADWHARAELVRQAGTPAVLAASVSRWFAPGFLDRDPQTGTALLWSLQEADRFSYARCCEALAGHDLRGELSALAVPLLAVAGSEDAVTPPALAEELAAAVRSGRSAVVPGVAHLAPAEAPDLVAALLRDAFTGGV
ncbi:alpha/beta fold hydrolase [Cellulomonas sp. KRMCY2]|uniref:alpha/beta fold hydrolase n=1 Tax=Cellulomonas sp. KRMCY2 TaxID=1304865 RepID=UPI00045E8C13|nr:alpha/beta fold hydrolase [Cellulomonas sp. KRMCY2]